jgi:hypothetical protein
MLKDTHLDQIDKCTAQLMNTNLRHDCTVLGIPKKQHQPLKGNITCPHCNTLIPIESKMKIGKGNTVTVTSDIPRECPNCHKDLKVVVR